MKLEVDGIAGLTAELNRIAEGAAKSLDLAGAQGAQLVRSSAVRSIQAQSPGRQVRRTRRGGRQYTHTAATAGNAPNTDTGGLVRSIQVDRRNDGYYVGTTLEYGEHLEKTHPWLMPAFEANLPAIKQLFANALKRSTNG